MTLLKYMDPCIQVIIAKSILIKKSKQGIHIKTMEEELQQRQIKEMRTYLANIDLNNLLKNKIAT